ncbi:MAG: hypothetical protein QM703_20150 [Gemmatales bacterium]
MKFLTRLSLSLLLIIPVALIAQDLSKQTFTKFTSKEGKFNVLFPGKPQEQKQTKSTELGDIQIKMFIVPIGNDSAFFVSFNDNPEALKNSDPMQMLEGARNGVQGKEGELVSDEAIKFGPDKLPGRRFLIKKPGGTYVRSMVILNGLRLYQVMVIGKKEFVEAKEVDKFYKSFELTK